jgi:hypothetical protein
MVENAETDEAVVVGVSIFMVMKRTPQNEEGKTNEKD